MFKYDHSKYSRRLQDVEQPRGQYGDIHVLPAEGEE